MLNVPLGEKVQDRRPPLAHRRQAALEGRRQLARALHPLTVAVNGLRHLLEAWRGRQLAERESSACLRGARGMDGQRAGAAKARGRFPRSEEHTSELQSR